MEPSESLTEIFREVFFTPVCCWGGGIFYRERELLLPELDMPVRKRTFRLKARFRILIGPVVGDKSSCSKITIWK
jgi:hypothetical protein